MNSKHLIIISVLLFGSLWGLAELGVGELAWASDIPRASILTAIGVIFLVLGRRVWAAPGSSLTLAAVASAFKFLQHPMWGCKIAAVLMVGVIFDVGFSLYEARQRQRSARFAQPSTSSVLVLSPILTLISFITFAYFARDVIHNPYWSSPSKMANYMFVQGPVAAALALPAALAGLRLSAYLTRSTATWSTGRWLAYRIAAAGSGAASVAAALALRH
ncbi:MAG: hypothetical protein KAW67_02850 [Candidatus Eisenbacteria sp.]|nr:hypothetical protein [Candidatus Eisenbacteria bacterium]